MTWALGRKGPEAAVRNGRCMEHMKSVQRTGTYMWGWGTGEQWLRLRGVQQEGINTLLGTPWGAVKISYRAVMSYLSSGKNPPADSKARVERHDPEEGRPIGGLRRRF